MTDYTPIDCGLYSEYELAVLHKRRLRISWRETDGQIHILVLLPTDLRTRNHAEFLVAEDSEGRQLELRLDQIVKIQPV